MSKQKAKIERAVIYCRVSTEEESQTKALVSQVEEAKQAVVNKGWVLVDEYVDEGKSGTTTKKRDEYKRLCEDMLLDKFDILCIKSQDRLMRNTMEWYTFVDKLVQNGKRLYFYLENTFYQPDDALIRGIKAILAEEYSRELSKKIKNAHRNRQLKGKKAIIPSQTWGYDVVNHQIVVNEEEAKIVKFVFTMYASGYGGRYIARELSAQGVTNRLGKPFSAATALKIARNPLFYGTQIVHKREYDFNTKKTNHVPKDEWIYFENAVPPIVSKALWDDANAQIDSRKLEWNMLDGTKPLGRKKSHYPLSGKIYCSECGSTYIRRTQKRVHDKVVYWICRTYSEYGRKTPSPRGKGKRNDEHIVNDGCDNISLWDTKLQEIFIQLANKLLNKNDSDVLAQAIEVIEQAIENLYGDDKVKEINNRISKNKQQREFLLEKYLDGIITDELYSSKDKKLQEEEFELRQNIAEIEQGKVVEEVKIRRIEVIKNEIENIASAEALAYSLQEHVEKIIVYRDYFEIYFDVFETEKVHVIRKAYKTADYIIL